MISHYHVTFKGCRCALISSHALGETWLLRKREREEFARFTPLPRFDSAKARDDEIRRTRAEIVKIITRTDEARKRLRGSLIENHPVIARLLKDAPDRRKPKHHKTPRRWRIVPVHVGGEKS